MGGWLVGAVGRLIGRLLRQLVSWLVGRWVGWLVGGSGVVGGLAHFSEKTRTSFGGQKMIVKMATRVWASTVSRAWP